MIKKREPTPGKWFMGSKHARGYCDRAARARKDRRRRKKMLKRERGMRGNR